MEEWHVTQGLPTLEAILVPDVRLWSGIEGISCSELLGVPVCQRLEYKRTPLVY